MQPNCLQQLLQLFLQQKLKSANLLQIVANHTTEIVDAKNRRLGWSSQFKIKQGFRFTTSSNQGIEH